MHCCWYGLQTKNLFTLHTFENGFNAVLMVLLTSEKNIQITEGKKLDTGSFYDLNKLCNTQKTKREQHLVAQELK